MDKGAADEIREFARSHIIDPARRRGEIVVRIRAGDVHNQMGLRQRIPAVCSAIGSRKFENLCRIRKIVQEGPHNGPSALFIFELAKKSTDG